MTAPLHWGAEIRCYVRGPDVDLIEAGQAGLVERWLAERASAGGEAGRAGGR